MSLTSCQVPSSFCKLLHPEGYRFETYLQEKDSTQDQIDNIDLTTCGASDSTEHVLQSNNHVHVAFYSKRNAHVFSGQKNV